MIQYRYKYDALGQLTREDNRPLNRTYTYTYYKSGNRASQKTYTFTLGYPSSPIDTKTYTYSNGTWGDLLTNDGTNNISYDAIGNPSTLNGHALTWQGRRLTSYDLGDDDELTFIYNADGIRTGKSRWGEDRYYQKSCAGFWGIRRSALRWIFTVTPT